MYNEGLPFRAYFILEDRFDVYLLKYVYIWHHNEMFTSSQMYGKSLFEKQQDKKNILNDTSPRTLS